jgi:hypothetical protein
MARYKGSGGDVYVDQSSAGSGSASPMRYISKWTLDGETEQIEVTAFGDSTKVFTAGLPNAQGTVSGFADDTATTGTTALFTMSQSGVARKTYFYPKTPSTSGPYWFGTANWSISVETDVQGAVSITGSWSAATGFQVVG